MEDYKLLELPVIYDLLASHTASYTQMLNQGAPVDEFELCKDVILRLQAELDARKIDQATTLSEREINFGGETST